MLAAAQRHIGLKVVGMTREYWKTLEIVTAERGRGDLREGLGIRITLDDI